MKILFYSLSRDMFWETDCRNLRRYTSLAQKIRPRHVMRLHTKKLHAKFPVVIRITYSVHDYDTFVFFLSYATTSRSSSSSFFEFHTYSSPSPSTNPILFTRAILTSSLSSSTKVECQPRCINIESHRGKSLRDRKHIFPAFVCDFSPVFARILDA